LVFVDTNQKASDQKILLYPSLNDIYLKKYFTPSCLS